MITTVLDGLAWWIADDSAKLFCYTVVKCMHFHTIFHNFTTLVFIDTGESSSGRNHSSNITQKGWIHYQYKLMHKLRSIWQKDVKLVCTYVQIVDYFMMYYHLYYNLVYSIKWSIANTNNYVTSWYSNI